MSERASWATDEKAPRWHQVTADGVSLDLLQRDTCRTFHDLMDAAMLQNAPKYGDVHKAYPDRVDAIASAEARIERYKQDGNVRWLVDAANFLMLEFALPRHEKAHLGEDLSIGRVVPGVGEATEKSNRELTASPVELRYSRGGD